MTELLDELTGILKPRREIINAASDKKAWVKRLLSENIKVNIVFRKGAQKVGDRKCQIKKFQIVN